MGADAMLRALSDDRWRWIEQGRIEGEERDRISSLRNAERRGERRGEQRGKQKGAREKALDAARKLLEMKLLTHEQIAEAVELSLEEVEQLAAQQ